MNWGPFSQTTSSWIWWIPKCFIISSTTALLLKDFIFVTPRSLSIKGLLQSLSKRVMIVWKVSVALRAAS